MNGQVLVVFQGRPRHEERRTQGLEDQTVSIETQEGRVLWQPTLLHYAQFSHRKAENHEKKELLVRKPD